MTHLDSSAGTSIDVINPADGEVVGRVAVESAESVRIKVDCLRANQKEWESMGARSRRDWLLSLSGLDP